MSNLRCKTCGYEWDGQLQPLCPACVEQYLLRLPNLLTPKHDPQLLSSPVPSFRSVMSNEYLSGSASFIHNVVTNGTVLYSPQHGAYSYVVGAPFGVSAGSAVLPNNTYTSYAFDAFIVAKIPGPYAHIYAGSQVEIQKSISTGKSFLVSTCEESGCNNLSVPGLQKCSYHIRPSHADSR